MASSQPLRILVVVAHPHDFTHVSGTCGKHADRGDRVTVVSVTGGAGIHNEPLERELRKPKAEQDPRIVGESRQQYATRKAGELHGVCGIFGITDVRILPFRDLFLQPSEGLDEAIQDIILEVRPHVLLTHAPYTMPSRGRPSQGPDDHRETGIAVERAVARAGSANPETHVRPHRIARIIYMGVEASFNDWDLVIDITDQATRRAKAEAMFATQGHTEGFALKRINIGSGSAGWYGGFAYGEAFLFARACCDEYLPVSEAELRDAERPTTEHMDAIGTRIEDLLARERET